MICPTCRGRGFVPAGAAGDDDDLVEMKPCPECLGGIASCCDAAGSGDSFVCVDCGAPIFPATPGRNRCSTCAARPSFTCPRCGAVSYNPNDIRERYCGRCHAFVEDGLERLRREGEEDHARRARVYAQSRYRDDTFPERLCAGCAGLYRGPAVYCSLECAIDDA